MPEPASRASHSSTRTRQPGSTRHVSDENHFDRLSRLLKMEAEAEAEQTLRNAERLSNEEAERRGLRLVRLVIREEDAGLGGRILLTLGRRDQQQSLSWTLLRSGAPVLLTEENSSTGTTWRAVVSRQDRESIQIALDVFPEPQSDRPSFRLDLASDEIALKRQQSALSTARAARGDRVAELREVLLAHREPELDPEPQPVTFLDATLNEPQREAIRFALASRDVAIVHGPPGTGKTTTLVELVRQAVRRGWRVLACAPSNLAVDNLLERLLAAGEKALRLGHPARVMPGLQEHTLDAVVEADADIRLARKLVREAHALRRQADRWTRAKPEPGTRQNLRAEAGRLIADARRLEAQAVERALDGAPILCATMTGLDSSILGRRRFDLAVLDESSQAVEPACWIPVLRSERVVLAGDHLQLPPTIVSEEAAREGLRVSLQERLIEVCGPTIARRLTVQYRMNQAIMEFSSEELYEGTLVADASVREHVLAGLSGVTATELTTRPLELIDTAGASYDEELEPGGESRRNPQEAELIVRRVQALLEAGVKAEVIAVITPYSAQVRLLRERLDGKGLEVDSVDGFQGREKEAVLVSLVRSNADAEIGFLSDIRRMNVALTRARRKLIVVGDSATIGAHPFYRRLLEHFERHGAYRTVWEEM